MPKKPYDHVAIVHRVKRGKDTYWLRWREDGKTHERRASDHPKLRKQQQREQVETLQARQGATTLDLTAAFDRYCTTELAPESVKRMRAALEQFSRLVRCPTTFDVRPDVLKEYRRKLAEKGYAPTALNSIMARLRMCLKRWRIANLTPELTAEAEALALRAFKTTKSVIVPYTGAELRAILAACKPKFGRMVLFAMLTGMRRGELGAVSVDWIDLAAGVVRVPPMKTGRGRAIDLRVSPMLRHLVEHHADELATWTAWKLNWHRQNYGGPAFTWQRLRQTCASFLVNSDLLPPFRAARQLGHTLAVAEDRYYGVITSIPAGVASLEEAYGIN